MNNEEHNVLKTKDYASQSAEDGSTQTYSTVTDSRTDRTTAHNLGVGDAVQLNQAEYRIERIISGEKKSGEAVIYLIRDDAGNDFALKLYYPFRDARDEPNSEALKRINEIDNPDILKLHHFGTGAEKFNGQFCYEISDFAKGGDLLKVENIKEKYTPDFIERHVIREIFKGIQVLHENRIYHCDLKPQNVFYRDENQTDLVIGDYGSAKTFEQSSEKELSYMSVVKGTDFYLAPEQAIGIISEKNDYYSFGMIILHLLYPEKIDQQTLRKIYERRAAEKPIIDYDPKYKRLNDLIAGLTLQDIQQRWGQKEVSQWLAGKSVAVLYKKATAPSVMPIKLGKVTIQTEEDLLEYVGQGEEWYSYLIEDEQGYHLLLTWLSQVQNIESKQNFDALMKAASPKGIRFAQEAVLRYFRPDRPVHVITELNVFGAEDIYQVTKDFIEQLEDQWKITELTDMTWYVFCFGMALEQYKDAANEEMKASADKILNRFLKCFPVTPDKNPEIKTLYQKGKSSSKKTVVHESSSWDLASRNITDQGLAELFHEFNPDRPFRDLAGNPVLSFEEVGLLFASNLQFWNNRFLKAEREQYLIQSGEAHLNQLTYDPFLLKVFEPHLTYDLDVISMNPDPENGQEGKSSDSADGVELHYQITRSADVFLSQKNIREPIREIVGADRIIVRPIRTRPAEDIVKALLLTLENKFNLPGDRWTPHSVDNLRTKFIELQNKLKNIADIEKKIKVRSDIGYAVKSFFFLIPPVFLYFIFLAFHEKNIAVIDFISQFTPFTMSFEHAYWSGNDRETFNGFETGVSLTLFLLFVFLPSLPSIAKDLEILDEYDKSSFWTITGSLTGYFGVIIFLLFWVALLSTVFPLPVMIIVLTVPSLIFYSSRKNRLRPVPFVISLIPALLLLFAGNSYFKNLPLSSSVEKPLNAKALLFGQYFLRTGPGEHYPVIDHTINYAAAAGHSNYDTVNVIDEKSGWCLIQMKNAEGYIPVTALKRIPIMKGIIHNRNPYLMAEPSYESKTLEALSKGSTVSILGIAGDWFYVREGTSYGGAEGYLHSKDVLVKKDSIRPSDPFTDPRDGKTYKTVKIGDQVWMAENLNYDAGKGSWCYKNDRSHCVKYGRLYDWKTAKRAAPPGWRLPSKDEFETLVIYLGGAETGAYGRIISGEPDGFNVLFGGHRSPYSDHFESDYYGRMDLDADFWSSTESNDSAWRLNVNSVDKTVIVTTFPKEYALSVRLVRN